MASRRRSRLSGAHVNDLPIALEHLAEAANPKAPASFAERGLETLLGTPYSRRRKVSAFVLAFVVSSIVRQLCFWSLPSLAKNLAPIERDNVEWAYVAAARALDLMVAMSVWWSSGRAVDPPALGILLTLISRPPLYSFAQHYFLISSKTASQVLTTDLVSYGIAAWVIAKLAPRKPTFRRQPIAFLRSLDTESLQVVLLAMTFGTLVSALTLFVTDRIGLKSIIRMGTEERLVPVMKSTVRWGFTFARRHPSVPIPVFRTDLAPLSMSQCLLYSIPLSTTLTALAIFVLPQAPISRLSSIAVALTGPQTAMYLHNVLPFKLSAAVVVGAEVAIRAALTAAVTAWTLTDVRQPVTEAIVAKKRL